MANQSYHIYLHDNNGKSSNNKTIPTEEISETIPTASVMSEAKGVGNFLKNPVGSFMSSAMEYVPYIAVATAVFRLTDKIVETSVNWSEISSGTNTQSMYLSNIRTLTKSIFSPISSTITAISEMKKAEVVNKRIQEQRLLNGNAVINTNGKGAN